MHMPVHTCSILACASGLMQYFKTSYAHMMWRQRKSACTKSTHTHTQRELGSSYACPSTHPRSEQDTSSHRRKPRRQYRLEPIARSFLFLLSVKLKLYTHTRHQQLGVMMHPKSVDEMLHLYVSCVILYRKYILRQQAVLMWRWIISSVLRQCSNKNRTNAAGWRWWTKVNPVRDGATGSWAAPIESSR